MAKKADIPYGSIAMGIIVLTGGYLTLDYMGLIPHKPKKSKCDSDKLSIITNPVTGLQTKFAPDKFATKIKNCYSGINVLANPCNELLELIVQLSDDDLRCANNAFIAIYETESLYKFLAGQAPYPYTEEADAMDAALMRMELAGLQ